MLETYLNVYLLYSLSLLFSLSHNRDRPLIVISSLHHDRGGDSMTILSIPLCCASGLGTLPQSETPWLTGPLQVWTFDGYRWSIRQYPPPAPRSYRGWANEFLSGGRARDVSLIARAGAPPAPPGEAAAAAAAARAAAAAAAGRCLWETMRVPLYM